MASGRVKSNAIACVFFGIGQFIVLYILFKRPQDPLVARRMMHPLVFEAVLIDLQSCEFDHFLARIPIGLGVRLVMDYQIMEQHLQQCIP